MSLIIVAFSVVMFVSCMVIAGLLPCLRYPKRINLVLFFCFILEHQKKFSFSTCSKASVRARLLSLFLKIAKSKWTCSSENISSCWAGNTDTKWYSIRQATRCTQCTWPGLFSHFYTPETWILNFFTFFLTDRPFLKRWKIRNHTNMKRVPLPENK